MVFARSTPPILSKSRLFSSVISLLQKRDSLLKCCFQATFGPHQKNLCWCCSLYGVHVVLAHILCVPIDIWKPRKTQETKQKQQKQAENPGKPRKPDRNNRNKQKTQENPGKPRNKAEKKDCNSIESFKYEQSAFCLPSYPPSPPPPGALSRNGGALSLNNVFPAKLFGKHGRKTLSLNSLLSAENLENHFQVAPKLQKQ